MKTNFRMCALVAGVTSLVLCVGRDENKASAGEPLAANLVPAYALADVPAEQDEKQPAPAPAKPTEAPVPVVRQDEAPSAPVPAPAEPAVPPVPPGSIIITKASNAAATNPAPAAPTNPGNVGPTAAPAEPPKLSPALSEVVRLLQANVSPDVLLAFITNCVQPFYMGANEIVYLHDLGAPPAIVTSLINLDSSPEMQARKQAAISVKPLPPGVALNEPATNANRPFYPPRPSPQPFPNPPEPMPVNPPPNNGASVNYPPPPDANVIYDYPQPPVDVNYSYFYDSLSPYGSWCDVPGYGSCWRPTCATWNSAWRPYSDGGRWLWSDQGWYWYSDYSWGWAPFHYGRWCQPSGYGWVWQPDTCWGPSWVSWRSSPNYCGWAPLPPSACYVSGLGFYYHNSSVGIGFEFGLGAADYCYVPTSRFCDPHPHNYCLPPHQNQVVHKETTVINNYVVGNHNTIVNNGVGFDKVAKVTRGDIKRVALRDTTSLKDLGTRHDRFDANGSTLTVYRPPTSVLTRKSVVPAPSQPVVSPSRPALFAKPGSTIRGSTLASPAPASLPGAPAGVKSYTTYTGPQPGAVNSRTTPSPVTLYTKPLSAASEPVIVTGGTPAPVPYVKPEPPGNESPLVTKPSANFGSAGRVPSAPTGGDPARAPIRPAASSGVASAGSAALPAKSGFARGEPGSGYTQPVAPGASVARSPAPSYPRAVAPSHNPSYAAPTAGYIAPSSGYVAPSRAEVHHSQVSSPAVGHVGGGGGGLVGPAVRPSGSSGGSSGGSSVKSADVSGGKGR